MLSNYPEDSVLRRHALTAEKMSQFEALKRAPTDSTLLRHYQQLHALETDMDNGSVIDCSANTLTAATAPQSDYNEPPRSGFLGLLRRLFGI